MMLSFDWSWMPARGQFTPFVAPSEIRLFSTSVRRVIQARMSGVVHGLMSVLPAMTLSPTSASPGRSPPMFIRVWPPFRSVLFRMRLRLDPLSIQMLSPVFSASLPMSVIVQRSMRLSLEFVILKAWPHCPEPFPTFET